MRILIAVVGGVVAISAFFVNMPWSVPAQFVAGVVIYVVAAFFWFRKPPQPQPTPLDLRVYLTTDDRRWLREQGGDDPR